MLLREIKIKKDENRSEINKCEKRNERKRGTRKRRGRREWREKIKEEVGNFELASIEKPFEGGDELKID